MKKAGLSKMAIGKCFTNIKFEHEKEPNYFCACLLLAAVVVQICCDIFEQ
jgi:hypothetical protein